MNAALNLRVTYAMELVSCLFCTQNYSTAVYNILVDHSYVYIQVYPYIFRHILVFTYFNPSSERISVMIQPRIFQAMIFHKF